ncbi:hypothetical protein [Pseudovibrio sp. Tun.PSC04-5.I4]|uniref:hypothetical protein n=1 Tax=Pseudovibrio sp. Tun.PSC04-5.I4 TaxID=1798213 RepID=UPI00088446FC|nr:hypothetical protein [Pseudovibrio sp. Tun.PSC04-5.I4]SDR48216.1 hypothetical protein SAMN04515695_5939 [Pseudovibrio sp. Tun.PSC04-5.I4]
MRGKFRILILTSLSFMLMAGLVYAQTDNSADVLGADADADPLKGDYPDIVSPMTDCPDIAEKYRSGGANADPLGYAPNFGFSSLSAADQQACIKEINKDGDINEKQETQEEGNILQN